MCYRGSNVPGRQKSSIQRFESHPRVRKSYEAFTESQYESPNIHNFARCLSKLNNIVKTKRLSPYYFFEANVSKFKGAECIWSRVGCYTWNEVGTAVNQYGQWFLNQGVVPGDLVAVYLHNSPEFVFVWLGLIAIGAAPALINYNLAGKALVHSLDTSRAKLLLVDEDAVFQERIGEVMKDGSIGGMVLSVLDANLKAEIGQLSSQRLEDWRREEVKPDWPFALVYTSGTTGTPKACPFEMGRFYPMASAVCFFLPQDFNKKTALITL